MMYLEEKGLHSKNEFDFSNLVPNDNTEFKEINPEAVGVEPLRDIIIPRYNPFTKEFENVPENWRLKRNPQTGEWHYRPAV